MHDLELAKLEKEAIGLYVSSHPIDYFSLQEKYIAHTPIQRLNEMLKSPEQEDDNAVDVGLDMMGKNTRAEIFKHIGVPFTIIGMLSECKTLMSKKGNPYGRFSLTDRTGDIDFTVFGSQFGMLKNLLIDDNFVIINLQYQKGRYDADKIEPLFHSIKELPSAFERTKSLTFDFDMELITNSNMVTVHRTLTEHPGENPIHFQIKDSANNTLNYSSTQSALIDVPLVRALDAIPDINFSLVFKES